METNLEAKFEHHKKLCDIVNDTYREKNPRYKDGFAKNLKKQGYGYAIGRLSEKLDRLEALLVEGADRDPSESIDDSFIDLADYALITLTELHAAIGIVNGYTPDGTERGYNNERV